MVSSDPLAVKAGGVMFQAWVDQVNSDAACIGHMLGFVDDNGVPSLIAMLPPTMSAQTAACKYAKKDAEPWLV